MRILIYFDGFSWILVDVGIGSDQFEAILRRLGLAGERGRALADGFLKQLLQDEIVTWEPEWDNFLEYDREWVMRLVTVRRPGA